MATCSTVGVVEIPNCECNSGLVIHDAECVNLEHKVQGVKEERGSCYV